jgi:hypothetical protein
MATATMNKADLDKSGFAGANSNDISHANQDKSGI